MSQKQNKKNVPPASATSKMGFARLLQEEIVRIRELIAGKHSKSALQLAKDLYKRSATTESETLLTDAYKARIDDLLRLGMTEEAKTLLGIMRERFPQALPRLTELGREICAQDGKLEEVVAQLADRELPAEERDRIETLIRQRIWDLRALGAVSSLPSEHSLRKAASALAAAFQAVTTGPVDDAVLELPEVSRRSPLASWKALIWAIACYHRGEDEECGRWLQTIPIDSVPARVLPTFTVMLKSKPGAKTESKSNVAAQKLIAEAGDHGAALRSALIDLEDALQAKQKKRILDAAQTAMAATNHCGAVTRERLRQHIEVRSEMQRIPQASIDAALGGAPRRDAYYFRLLARTLEDQQNMDSDAEAVVVWSEFRREAIKEKWFTPGGLEDGILSLHMAELIERVPAEIIEDLKEEMTLYRNPGKGNKEEEQVPSPATLYERACKADPHLEAFQAWLNWARKQDLWQVADNVAEQWRMSRPADIQPLLYLMESTEKRDAFKKSLKYLDEAENLDRLNPEVRRARLRLLLSGTLRHLQQRKAHLALGGIEQIETVPEVRPGEIAALGAALRWCAAMIGQEKAVQGEQETQLNKLMGSVAAHLLMASVAEKAEMLLTGSLHPLKIATIPAVELLGGVARSCVLGEWAGLAIALPRDWNKHLIAALNLPNSLDAAQMRVMGEAALDRHSAELGYAVSTAGLAKGGANAEFLFLRARSLPLQTSLRREGCTTASLELARRERNTGLAGRILDHLNGKKENDRRRWRFGSGMGYDQRIASRVLSPQLLSKILEEEQRLDQFPGYDIGQAPQYAEELGDSFCDCPKCRARRGEDGEDIDDGDNFDDGDDFDEEEEAFDGSPPRSLKQMAERLEQMLSSLPPPLAQAVAQHLKKAVAAGESPIDAIERIMGLALRKPGSPASSPFKKKEKPAMSPPPEQGSLF
jgi:hypothetical protein